MSTPIQSEKQADKHLVYAPPWARGSSRTAEKSIDRPWRPELSRPMAPGTGGPNLDPPSPNAPTFEGDIGIIQLRRSLSSLEPDVVPHPPFARQVGQPRTHWAIVAGFSASVVLAGMVATGVTMMSLAQSPRDAIRLEKKGDRSVVVADASGGIVGMSEQQSKLATRLVLETRQAYANEPLPLRLAVNGASGDEHLLVKGLSAGTRLSAGMPFGTEGWRLASQDIGKVLAYPPQNFIGTMNAAVDLRSPRNTLMDSQLVRLEWLPNRNEQPARTQPRPDNGAKEAKPEQAVATLAQPKRQLAPEQIQMLLDRGRKFIKLGDIAAARLVLKRAASAGNASAALELGATYDPEVLKELGVLGFAADAEQARTWYRRASELGSPDAAQRIDHLAQVR